MAKIKRGPKRKTAANSKRGESAGIWMDIAPPVELSAEAESEFLRLVEVLRRAGTLDKVDVVVVANAARIKDLIDRAHEELARDGLTVIVESKFGCSTRSHPMLSVINSLIKSHRVAMNDLGLTPASAKLTTITAADPASAADPMNKFLVIG